MPEASAEAVLEPATHRLVRGVDALADGDWAAPSALPGWTRAHVVAHLALNAEALIGGINGILEGTRTPMYASPEARDTDIADLAKEQPAALRDRFLATSTLLSEAIAGLPANLADASFPRTPGSDRYVRAAGPGGVAEMRLREVEIHHADLDVGYGRADWPDGFAALVLDFRTTLWPRDDASPGFTASASDLGDDLRHEWTFGTPAAAAEGPTVSGASRDLAWWATGRGSGEGLTSERGDLPQIGAW